MIIYLNKTISKETVYNIIKVFTIKFSVYMMIIKYGCCVSLLQKETKKYSHHSSQIFS